MTIHVALNHVTRYRYDRRDRAQPAGGAPAPRAALRARRCIAYSLRVAAREALRQLAAGPPVELARALRVPREDARARRSRSTSSPRCRSSIRSISSSSPTPRAFPFKYDACAAARARALPGEAARDAAFKAYLDEIPRAPTQTNDFLVELNRQLAKDVRYLIRMEPGVQTPEETLALASGSCRDSGWLLVQLLRHLGIAARFVSGYLIQLTADVKSLDGPPGRRRDFTDLHAWCEVYLPGAGWVGLDPTSGLLAGEGHIPLACTPEPAAAAPLTGLTDECEVEFSHEMRVERVREAPRVTKPYTEEQWSAIEALGRRVDADLAARDVRLTMGGEPTFVSIDDRDGAEWNTEAMGPTKRLLGAELLKRTERALRAARPAALRPGQVVSGRAAAALVAVVLLAQGRRAAVERPRPVRRRGAPTTARRRRRPRVSCEALAERLGLDPKYVFPAYEDAWYYLWRERRLPANVDPFDARLDDPIERARLRKVFLHGLDKAVGHALPLKRDGNGTGAGRPDRGSCATSAAT